MKMVLTSGVFSIVIGVVAYYILINMGMDSANVMSSINVRLQYLKSTKRIKKNDKNNGISISENGIKILNVSSCVKDIAIQ